MSQMQLARALLAALLASAAPALAADAAVSSHPRGAAPPESMVIAATYDGLPGEGRPPSPGPTNPNAPMY